MLKAGFLSLGCAKNLVDTEVMLGILTENHVEIVQDPVDADLLIVNTCGFIDSAKEESLSTILSMAEYKQTGKCRGLIVAGCLGERYRQDLLDELPEIDAIVGTGSWHRIMEAVNAVLSGQRLLIADANTTIYDDTTPRITTTPFYSAYVKVADGCNNRCAYCAIPFIRGDFRSRSIESIENEVKRLVAQGTKEIILIAQDTTNYGQDLYGKPSLPELLKALVKINDLKWIRLLYGYPVHFSDEIIQLMAKEPKILHYVDLPLQHAHDDILRAMHRPETQAEIKTLLQKLRDAIPDVVVRTSFIVGFPGETEEHFQELLDFVREQRFQNVGVFMYSQEEGTSAAKMANQVDEAVKEDRYHRLMAEQSRVSEELNLASEGQIIEVLVEGRTDDNKEIVYGRSYREAPEVDGRVYIENAGSLQAGDLVLAKIVQGFTYDILAEKLES
ncbi:MAG: 30S ribosomal protein S12 methylthiotransferase RimO [Sporomusaceae bacterium]|nr:30S ribosomal protein S12 methylthiotransferase RimO [Sporomusaceae bacterium]